LLIIFTTLSVRNAYTQDAISLDKAIQESAEYFNNSLPVNSTVAVLHIKSHNQALGHYIIGELINDIIILGNIIPVDRNNIDIIKSELDFNLSGDISDESEQAIGKMLGAQIIITGEIFVMNSRMYRMELKAISVESAAIQGTVNKNILVDKNFKTITGSSNEFLVSIGFSIHLGGTFSVGTQEEKGSSGIPSLGPYLYNYKVTETNNRNTFDIGGCIFLDFKYAEINMGLLIDSGKTHWLWEKDYYYNNSVLQLEESRKNTDTISTTLLNIGILGKYPFDLNNIILYPAIGADYQLWLLHSENRKKTPGDLSGNNSVWIKVGGGMDYNFTQTLFMRTELIWGIKLPSKNETKSSFSYFTHSPSAHIGIGYIFNRKR